jgi:phosphohistidine phosphatase SixA
MRLYFVRHGIAENLAASDFIRALTKRGRRRVATSAQVMKRLGMAPVQIFSSPRLRSRQTAEIIAAALDMPVTISEPVNFGFDLGDLRRLTRNLGADDEVMFVGHNPDMSLLVSELTGLDASMKKGGLARIDVLGRTVDEGELVWLIAPKVFDALQAQAIGADASKATSEAMPMQKQPATSQPLHKLIHRRWSPLGFDRHRDVDRATLLSILEAARWAASSYNLQPWRFIVAPRGNKPEFQKVLSVLGEGNQAWAQHAAVLMIAAAHTYSAPGTLNRHASHDLGLAISQLVLQALDHDVYVHQMGGFFPEKARELYDIPAEFEPFTAIALGYQSLKLDHLSDGHREREAAPRQRQAMSEMVFNGSWARPADFLDESKA